VIYDRLRDSRHFGSNSYCFFGYGYIYNAKAKATREAKEVWTVHKKEKDVEEKCTMMMVSLKVYYWLCYSQFVHTLSAKLSTTLQQGMQ
jgi:hypothetical protein